MFVKYSILALMSSGFLYCLVQLRFVFSLSLNVCQFIGAVISLGVHWFIIKGSLRVVITGTWSELSSFMT